MYIIFILIIYCFNVYGDNIKVLYVEENKKISKIIGYIEGINMDVVGSVKYIDKSQYGNSFIQILWTHKKQHNTNKKIKFNRPIVTHVIGSCLPVGKKIKINQDFIARVSGRNALITESNLTHRKQLRFFPPMTDKDKSSNDVSLQIQKTKEENSGVDGDVFLNKIRTKQKQQGQNNMITNYNPLFFEEQKSIKEHNITVTDGCNPRIDINNDKVLIQNKIITYRDNIKIKETQCKDSTESYNIKKDYNCHNCIDKVNEELGVVYQGYIRYWYDKHGNKHILSNNVEYDDDNKYLIIKDDLSCSPYVNVDDMLAFKQTQLYYYNNSNKKIIIKTCHVPDSLPGVAITETTEGCSPTHDLNNNWSILQKKGIFNIDDIEHVAFGCKEVGRPQKHEYETDSCALSTNLELGYTVVMGKKFVTLDNNRYYLTGCEPIDHESILYSTRDGCYLYIHDLPAGKSYLTKRWYYNNGLNRVYISDCDKSEECREHHYQVIDYQHDDLNKKSSAIVDVFIKDEGRIVDVKKSILHPLQRYIPYKLLKTFNKQTNSFVYDGCYKLTAQNKYELWERPDKTTYEIFIGVGEQLRSVDLCQYNKEYIDKYLYSLIVKLYGFRSIYDNITKQLETYYLAKKTDLPTAKRIHDPNLIWRNNDLSSQLGYVEMKQKYLRDTILFPSGEYKYADWISFGEPFVGKCFVPSKLPTLSNDLAGEVRLLLED